MEHLWMKETPAGIFFTDAIGELHRTDGPAILYNDGGRVWYCHGKLHRTDGPARIEVDGQLWAIYDEIIDNKVDFQEKSGLSDEEMVMVLLKYRF